MNRKLMRFSALAEVNPNDGFSGIDPNTLVSFIPMQDVTESGDWLVQQTRPIREGLSGYTLFKEGDILFAKITPCMENGKGTIATGLMNGLGFGSTEFHVLRTRAGVEKRFIYHLCQSRELRVRALAYMTGSAGQQRVQSNFFDNLKVRDLPPIEQRLIAHILDTLDEAIRRTDQLVAKLQQMKQGLLHDLLTRGVDENGEVRTQNLYISTSGSQHTLFPPGWQRLNLGRVLTGIDAGSSPAAVDIPASYGMPGVLKVSAVHPDGFRPGENKAIANTNRLSKPYEVSSGDLLLTRANTSELVGLPCLVSSAPPRLFLCDKTLRLHINNAVASKEFIFLALQHFHVRRQIMMHATGSSAGMKNISQEKIRQLQFVIPHPTEQSAIWHVFSAAGRRIDTETNRAAKLRALKAGLMSDLLTGEVRTTHLSGEFP